MSKTILGNRPQYSRNPNSHPREATQWSATLSNLDQCLEVAHSLKLSWDSSAAIETVSKIMQKNIYLYIYIYVYIYNMPAKVLLHFWQMQRDSNTHLKHCELRGIDNLSIACCKVIWTTNKVINFQLDPITLTSWPEITMVSGSKKSSRLWKCIIV